MGAAPQFLAHHVWNELPSRSIFPALPRQMRQTRMLLKRFGGANGNRGQPIIVTAISEICH